VLPACGVIRSSRWRPRRSPNPTFRGTASPATGAFVRGDAAQSGFPWLTLRERPDLNHFMPFFTDPDRPDRSPTRVRTASGDAFDVADPALAAQFGPAVRVIRHDRGVFDTFPLSLITLQTLACLGETVGMTLDVARFRPNILVDAVGAEPFLEDEWVGSVLRIGTLRLRVDKRDGRCVVITIDPVSTRRDPEVLRVVARQRQGCLGVYGSTVQPGRLAVGDAVVLETAQ
jgi:hypothetical protein